MSTDFRSKITAFLARGESVQIVGLPGMGKGNFGRSLGGFLLDPNFYPDPTAITLINAIKESQETKLIVIDSANRLLKPELQPFFLYLKALRDQHKYSLAYILLTHNIIGPEYRPLLGDFYETASEHIEHLPPIDPTQISYFGYSPTPKQIDQITKLSGGIPALIKICIMALRDGSSLDPEKNPKLKAQIEEMLSVSYDDPLLSHSQLVQEYIDNHPQTNLSAAETRLLNLLLENQNQIISKDQICITVYPDVKDRAGISDHAIDQLIHRLRTKIKSKYTVTTHRGLGYQLS